MYRCDCEMIRWGARWVELDPKHLSEPPLPEGPRGFLAPSVDVRGFHKTLEPSQIRPWHNYIPLPRNGLYYLNTNITGKNMFLNLTSQIWHTFNTAGEQFLHGLVSTKSIKFLVPLLNREIFFLKIVPSRFWSAWHTILAKLMTYGTK